MNAIYLAAHETLGRPLFAPAMSKNAREILDVVIGHFVLTGRTTGKNIPILNEFAEGYQAALYEDAAVGFDYKNIIKKMVKALPAATKDRQEQLRIAWLIPLINREWDKEVKEFPSSQFRFSHSVKQTASYDWLTTNFILDDFYYNDLHKLVEVIRQYDLDDIKAMCSTIADPAFHNISYLRKCLENDKQSITNVINKVNTMSNASDDTIADLVRIHNMPRTVKPTVDDHWYENMLITRKMLYGDE